MGIGRQTTNEQDTRNRVLLKDPVSDKGLTNVFTVDLEDWFQGLTSTNPQVERWLEFESRVVKATSLLLDILRQHRVEATFFVLGYVADRHPSLIARIHAAGHEIGVHGYFHRFVHRLTPDQFERDLELSMLAIERITHETPVGHRAPYFSINARTLWAFDILAAHGIRYDSSVFPTRNMLYGYPGAPRFPHWIDGADLLELPASTVKIGGVAWPAAGGFYSRLLPYAFTRWAIARLNRMGQPAILYIHPWELDTGQRYTNVTLRERITHYHGRRTLAAKLHRLFGDFRFAAVRSVFDLNAIPNSAGQLDSNDREGLLSGPNMRREAAVRGA